MTLIKSISGIRGTMGGAEGEGLTPIDIVKFSAAFCSMMQSKNKRTDIQIVVGRDARTSGSMVNALVCNSLIGMGAHIIDLGLTTTPTVEIAVPMEKAHAGIILTASHNPGQWNALKLLNEKGEFISASEGQTMLQLAESSAMSFATIDQLGSIQLKDYLQIHLDAILKLNLVNVNLIKKANLKVAVDAVNSTGGIYVPALLHALGVEQIEKLYCEPNGKFPHNPEPLAEHLSDISAMVKEEQCDLGIVVDPDVDRLAFVCEDGSMFGEEYTLVAVADYVLSNTPGNTVSNLSSTRALRDVTLNHGGTYTASAVGEVNVVEAMKRTNALIGGEGNGGIIYPASHYGRDALVGIALFLTHFATKKLGMTALRDSYPRYVMSKNKIELQPGMDVDDILVRVQSLFPDAQIITSDGVKFDFAEGWVHLRKSNTEPIVRVYAEHNSRKTADALAGEVMQAVLSIAAEKV
ncbi:MAG: phosphoglucosamine mutase [Flavobacteriales bacterium]